MSKPSKTNRPLAEHALKWLLAGVKTAGAGITAVAILSLMMCAYSFIPVHIDNPNQNTDYIWPAHSVWFRATEGIGWGRYDDNGYNNVVTYEHPDILLLGSSHMEAQYVPQKDNVAYVMNNLFDGTHEVYNMGISGHTFFKISQYLPRSIELYSDSVKYVILECYIINITQEDVDQVLEHKVDFASSHRNALMQLVNDVPALRIIDHQRKVGFFDLFMDQKNPDRKVFSLDGEEAPSEVSASDISAYDRMFEYLSGVEKDTGVELIIYYHPTETFDDKGNIVFERGQAYDLFTDAAERYDIDFVDVSGNFEKMFYKEHHVAHGFVTGRLGIGHLNSYGHRASAEALVKFINEKEADEHVDD